MKCRSVSIKEITAEDNKRLCLSPKRYLGKCFLCSEFNKCESRVLSKEYVEFKQLSKQKEELEHKLTEIKNKIKEVV